MLSSGTENVTKTDAEHPAVVSTGQEVLDNNAIYSLLQACQDADESTADKVTVYRSVILSELPWVLITSQCMQVGVDHEERLYADIDHSCDDSHHQSVIISPDKVEYATVKWVTVITVIV